MTERETLVRDSIRSALAELERAPKHGLNLDRADRGERALRIANAAADLVRGADHLRRMIREERLTGALAGDGLEALPTCPNCGAVDVPGACTCAVRA